MNTYFDSLDEHVHAARSHVHHKVHNGELHDRPLPQSRKSNLPVTIIPREFVLEEWLLTHQNEDVPSRVQHGVHGVAQHLQNYMRITEGNYEDQNQDDEARLGESNVSHSPVPASPSPELDYLDPTLC